MTVEQFHESDKLPLVVVLDNVRSLYNIGSVFRTCDAFRVAEVVLCGITAEWLQSEGYTLLAIEQCEGSTMLQHFVPKYFDEKYAVVLGNEVKGVQQQVVDACDGCLEIPQFGTKHSMNVSVTAGIVIWHFAQQLNLNC